MDSSCFADVADFTSGVDASLVFTLGVEARWPKGSTGTAGLIGPGVATAGFREIGGSATSCA